MDPRILTDIHLEQFKQHLITSEKSPHTVEKYVCDVRAFAAFLDDREVTKDYAEAFKQKLFETAS